MRHLNPYAHVPFLRTRLLAFLPEDSLAGRLKKTLGAELDSIFGIDGYDTSEYASLFPVRSLFAWIVKHGGLAIEDLEDTAGQLFDDNGSLVPPMQIRPISGSEQMAALGLWFIESELNEMGPAGDEDFDENGINVQGWSKTETVSHKAECLLNAYQALCYAERLGQETELSAEERAGLEKFDFSALGKIGAVVRHRPMNALRDYALSLYVPHEWSSANQAAHELQDKIVAYGRTINANLKVSNAQRTIAEWFRKKSV